MPLPPSLDQEDENEVLMELCLRGWRHRFDFEIDDETGKVYYNRLIEELTIIEKLDFTKYFLIVWELLDDIMEDLTEPEKETILSLAKGESVIEFAKTHDMTRTGIYYRLDRIKEKLSQNGELRKKYSDIQRKHF